MIKLHYVVAIFEITISPRAVSLFFHWRVHVKSVDAKRNTKASRRACSFLMKFLR